MHLGPQETYPEEGKSLIFKGEAKTKSEKKDVITALRKFNPSDLIGGTLEFIATNGLRTDGKIESIHDGMFTHYTIDVLTRSEFGDRITPCNLGNGIGYNFGYTLTIMR